MALCLNETVFVFYHLLQKSGKLDVSVSTCAFSSRHTRAYVVAMVISLNFPVFRTLYDLLHGLSFFMYSHVGQSS